MQTSKTVGKLLVVAGAIIMLAAPAMAGNGKGSGLGQGGGDRTRTQTKSRLKDGSCQIRTEKQDNELLLVRNGSGTGDCTNLDPVCTCAGKNCFCEGEA